MQFTTAQSVGRTVASNTRGPRFESSRRQILYYLPLRQNCIETIKIKRNAKYMKVMSLANDEKVDI